MAATIIKTKLGLLKDLFIGSSVKCVDAFRTALTEGPKLFIKQKHG